MSTEYYIATVKPAKLGIPIARLTGEKITRCIDCKAYGVCEIGLPPNGFCSNAEPRDKGNE